MKVENSIISIKGITFPKRINKNRRHFPSKFILLIILFILVISSIFTLIKLYKKDKFLSSNTKIKRKMSTYYYEPKYESEEEEIYASYGLVFILAFYLSIIYLISLILKFYTNGVEKVIFYIVLIYTLFIDISYIVGASIIIGKIPSSQIGYVISPYALFCGIITFLLATNAICLCCKISIIDYLIIFFSLPISHISIILNFSCCCQEIGGRISHFESNQGRNAVIVVRFATTNNQSNSATDRNNPYSNDNGYSYPYFRNDDCFVICCCGCLRIFFSFLYFILALVTFPLNFVLYYLGLIAITITLIPFYFIYIFPLIISFLFSKCCQCCCKNNNDNNNDNNQVNDKLSYEYFCNKNKAPLVLTLLIIILVVLSISAIIIMKYLLKMENIFTSII